MKHNHVLLALLVAALLSGCASRRSIEEQAYRDAMRDMAREQAQAAARAITSSQTAGQQRQLSAYEQWQLRVTQRIGEALADTACCRFNTAISIYDITSGQSVYSLNENVRMRPASTEKLVTAISVLDLLGPDYSFNTRVLASGTLRGGVLNGDLWIVGAMDPLLSAADLRTLCQSIRRAGVQRVEGSVCVDLGLKDDNQYGWGWCWDDKNSTLSPLLLDGKPKFTNSLASQLKAAGITLKRTAVKTGVLPAAAVELTQLQRPLQEVLEPMMKQSNNLYAECVFYQLSPLTGRRAPSHSDIARLINGVIDRAGGNSYHVQVADGSGLSLYNYQTAATFVSLLRYIYTKPNAYQALTQSLPIAAVDGTLKNRMASTAAASNLRAKTGTVDGVSTLTGFTTCRTTGHLLAFAVLTNGVRTGSQGRALQDIICTAISE